MHDSSPIAGWFYRTTTSLVLLVGLTGLGAAAELVHDTQSAFAPGVFDQTVLGGTETEPTIALDTTTYFDWTFSDDDITGWTFLTSSTGSTDRVAEENPAGQIHLRADAGAVGETYGLANRTDVPVPDVFSVEYVIIFDALQASGVADPFATQPIAGCARLDVTRSGVGIRVDVFTDRFISIYRQGTTGVDYPTTAYLDLPTGTNLTDGAPHVIRFDVDFTDPALTVAAYLDGGYVGDLVAHVLNSSPLPTLRQLAYSRASGGGLAEYHIDSVRLGTESAEHYATGSYTSPVLDLDPAAFTTLAWTSLPASPYPWSPWVKDADNPIIAGPCLNENILVDLDDPLMQPLLYEHPDPGIGQVYWMCYATGGGGGTIRLAYCEDANLDTWVPYADNPILAPDVGEEYVFSPNLFRDNGTYYLVFDVALTAADSGRQANAFATAPSPVGPFTRGDASGGIILRRGAPGEWDSYRATEPFVFKEGDTYFMFYMGDDVCSGCNEQIGLATTTAALFPFGPEPDGTWTKQGLVLPHNPDPTGWDRGLTADPSVIKVGGIYYLRYTGSYANEHWQLGTAWATDPYGPWHRPPQPDITLGAPGTWDDDRLVRGAIHYHNGRYYSPYTGNDGGAYRGGMASADPLAADEELACETSTSADGITWEDWQPVANGGPIASTPQRYVRYRATLTRSTDGFTPTLTSVTLGYAEETAAVLAPLAPSAEIIGCAETATVAFQLTPGAGTPPIRAYSATVQTTAPLSFTETDVAFATVPVGAETAAQVLPAAGGGFVIDYAILGPTPGITTPAIVFTITFHGASDGTGVVSITEVELRGLDNEPLPVLFDATATIVVDCTGPGAVGALTAARGHEQVALSWEDPTDPDLAGVEIWRAIWHDGAGASAYPEYDDLPSDMIPPRPADRAAASGDPDWTLLTATPVAAGEQNFTDAIAPRGIYIYEVFARDLYGNYGPVGVERALATNYILGDVTIPYDGVVSIADVSQLGACYGTTWDDGTNPDYDAECDVGPTQTMSAAGLPTTDDVIEFEDLVVFAINFGPTPPAPPGGKGTPMELNLAWYMVEAGAWSLVLTEAVPDLQGVNLRAHVPVAAVRDVALGEALTAGGDLWYLARAERRDLDVAVVLLGGGEPLAAGTELLRVTLADGVEAPAAATVTARDSANRELPVALTAEPLLPPASYRLYPSSPNPFNPQTVICFDLPEPQAVRLDIYDVSGRLIDRLVSRTVPAGRHSATWRGTDAQGQRVPSGVYFYRIEAGPLRETGKMMMVK